MVVMINYAISMFTGACKRALGFVVEFVVNRETQWLISCYKSQGIL